MIARPPFASPPSLCLPSLPLAIVLLLLLGDRVIACSSFAPPNEGVVVSPRARIRTHAACTPTVEVTPYKISNTKITHARTHARARGPCRYFEGHGLNYYFITMGRHPCFFHHTAHNHNYSAASHKAVTHYGIIPAHRRVHILCVTVVVS
jgi:hypothetical protein